MSSLPTAVPVVKSLFPVLALMLVCGCGTDGVPPPPSIVVDTQPASGENAGAATPAAATAATSRAADAQRAALRRARAFFSIEWNDADGYVIRPRHSLAGRRLGTHAMRAEALRRLTQARRDQIADSHFSALRAYEFLAHEHAGSDIAAEALFQQGRIHAARSELREAFDAFEHLTRSYPDFDRFDDALAWQYQIASAAKNGHRPYLWGVVPWFKDPVAALDWFEKVNRNAPYGPVAAQALFDKGTLALDNDMNDEALDAFDRVIWDYPDSPLVPESWLALARTREAAITGHDMEPLPDAASENASAPNAANAAESANAEDAKASLESRKITGHEWDQGATRDALNYYNEFVRRYPKHPKVAYAVRNAARMREILARNRYDLGFFYYEHRNNPRAAALFFHEAINAAPDSVVAREAEKIIGEILAGARAPAGTMDWLFGRYPQYKDTTYRVPPSAPDTASLGFRPAQ